ncbi:MAG: hypothetical protein WCP01_03715 [Methylococcaceae bacterium]
MDSRRIPYHSDFHREVSLWLQANRHLTHEERLAEVTFMMLCHKIDLDIPLLAHYAANLFTTMDGFLVETIKFPDEIRRAADAGASCADQIAAGVKTDQTREAVNAKHDRDGGSRDLKKKILAAWATGKYPTHEACADNEGPRLGFKTHKTALTALTNAPKPVR